MSEQRVEIDVNGRRWLTMQGNDLDPAVELNRWLRRDEDGWQDNVTEVRVYDVEFDGALNLSQTYRMTASVSADAQRQAGRQALLDDAEIRRVVGP